MLDELLRIAALAQVGTERQRFVARPDQRLRAGIETQDVGDHPQEGRAQQVPALREQRVDRRAVVLEAGTLAAQAEAHVRRLPGDAEFLEHRDEVRVRPVVENDEAGVHRPGAARELDIHRVGVAAGIVVRLEDRHVVVARKAPRRMKAGDAGADDRDPHDVTAVCAARILAGTCFRSRIKPSAASSRRP